MELVTMEVNTMKLKLIISSLAAIALSSCSLMQSNPNLGYLDNDPSWKIEENPLDNQWTETWPVSFGHFGPCGLGHPGTGTLTRPINGGNGTVENLYGSFEP